MNIAQITDKMAAAIKGTDNYRNSTPATCTDRYCASPSGLARKPHAHNITPLHAPIAQAASIFVGKVQVQ